MAELSAQPRSARTRDVPAPSRKNARGSQRKGEAQQATAAGLDLLRVLGWLVLHDVVIPADASPLGKEVAIDHVLAGPSGVYVVNTVTWSGTITATDGALIVGKVDHSEVLGETAAGADAVRMLLGGIPVAPLLCFERLEAVAGVAGDVALCASENILDLLTSQPEILDSHAVARASGRLAGACRPETGTPVQAAPAPVVAPVRRPATGPSVDDLVKARAEELAAKAGVESTEGSAEHPVPPSPEPERRGLARALRRPRRTADVVDAVAVEPMVTRDSAETVAEPEPEVVETGHAASVSRLPYAAVAEAGAALWLSLTEADVQGAADRAEVVAVPADLPVEEMVDVEAALLEAETRQRDAEDAETGGRADVLELPHRDAELDAQLHVEREAHDARARAARESLEQAEREAVEAEAREQAEQAEQAERERLEAEAREQAEREAEAEARAAWEARLQAAREAREREARESAAREADDQGRATSMRAHQPEVRRGELLLPDTEPERVTDEALAVAVHTVPVIASEEIDPDTWEPAPGDRWDADASVDDEGEWQGRATVDTPARQSEPTAVVPVQVRETDGSRDALPPVADQRPKDRNRLSTWARRRRRSAGSADREPRTHGMPARAVVNVALGALLIAGVILGAPHAHGVVTWAQHLVSKNPPTTVGTLVKVDADAMHPAVEVLAGTPVDAQATSGSGAGKGQHLIAVPFRLHNAGTSPWQVPLGARANVVDNLGVTHPLARAVKAVKAYPLLAGKTNLAPGQEIKGYAVFAVPDGRTVTLVNLGLSQAGGDPVTWQVTP